MQSLCLRRSARAKAHGLSLTELLASLTVAAIATAYALPSLQVLVANNQQTSVINRFVSSVLLARSIAVTRQAEAIICPTLDGKTCHDENHWGQGWLVMQLTPAASHTDVNAGSVIRVEQKLAGVSLRANQSVFRFRPRGRRATNGTAIMCNRHASRAKAVIVSYNGRPRTSRTLANGDAIPCNPAPLL